MIELLNLWLTCIGTGRICKDCIGAHNGIDLVVYSMHHSPYSIMPVHIAAVFSDGCEDWLIPTLHHRQGRLVGGAKAGRIRPIGLRF